MRFIGNKENLLDNLYAIVKSTGFESGLFCDFFAGTASVGRFFKRKGYKVISSDLLYFSYVLQRAYIKNNKEPKFRKLLKSLKVKPPSLFSSPLQQVIFHLNHLKGKQGFIYKNYTLSRKYFTPDNGLKIDSIRKTIETWKKRGLISSDEYFILLACLIETVPFYANISGTYGAFLKKYDPRALKKLALRQIKIFTSKNTHKVFNQDSMDLLNNLKTDILYLDPPYNSRQYGANYHLLETIAKYDNPQISGIAGLRDYSNQKSDFCNRESALTSLDKIANLAKYNYLLLSYNSEGIMPREGIANTLSRYGDLKIIDIDYRRFKSNNNGVSKHKRFIQEQVYLLRRK